MKDKRNIKLKNDKIYIINNKFNEKYSIFITLFFILIILKLCYLKKLLFNSEITFTIKGNGTQKILYKKIEHIPSQILINDVEIIITEINITEIDIEKTNYYFIYNFTNNINNITFIWNYTITNCSYMFNGLVNITDIYFTNFDTSQVVSMDYMFSYCYSITQLDLTSFDTSLVKTMSGMFYYCINLTSLDISTFNTNSVLDMSYMFCETNKLQSLNLSNFNTSSTENMRFMFSHMNKVLSLNLSNFDTSKVKDMNNLFGFSGLINLDISSFNTSSVVDMGSMFVNNFFLSLNIIHFDTSSVTNMEGMFDACLRLKSLDLRNFKTDSVIDMGNMFSWCHELTSLDLSNFNTSSVTDMARMFSACYALTSLDLSNFDTHKVNSIFEMFYDCTSLRTLIIDNFDFSSVYSFNSMFCNCSSLVSLDLHKTNFGIRQTDNNYNVFKGCNKNLTFCIDKEGINDNNIILNQISNFTINCSDSCFMPNRKIIPSISKCTMNCEKENIYKYEHNNLCYQSCPKETYYSYDNNYLCILGDEDKPEIESFSNFYSLCKFNTLNYGNKTKDEIVNRIRNELLKGNLDILISKYIENQKKDFLVNDTDNNILHQFTSTYNQNNNNDIHNNIGNNYSIIKLGECENNLRTKYELEDNDIILIYKVEIYQQGRLIPIIQYETYNPKKRQKLELDICKDLKINLEIPVLINEEEEIKYDSLSAFYNDFCFYYTTENETDIILKDRREEFNNKNMSLCEKDCEYKGYDFHNKRSFI